MSDRTLTVTSPLAAVEGGAERAVSSAALSPGKAASPSKTPRKTLSYAAAGGTLRPRKETKRKANIPTSVLN